MNLPNKLTVFRACMVPVFVFVMLWDGLGEYGKYVAAAVFIISSGTDWGFGDMGRKKGLVNDF